MLRNFVTSALRNIRKQRSFSILNIVGLTVGVAIFLFTDLLSSYERSYDTFFAKSDRIHIVTTQFVPGGAVQIRSAPSAPGGVAPLLRNLAGVERAVRSLDRPLVAQTGEHKFYQNVRFVDEEFFDIFDFRFVVGDAATALSTPSSIILSQTAATRYFGDQDPLGQRITLDSKRDMKVAGVFETLPANSHMSNSFILPAALEMMAPMSALRDMMGADPDTDWQTITSGDITYVLLREGARPETFDQALDELATQHIPESLTDLFASFRLAHLSRHNTFLEDVIGLPLYSIIRVLGGLILAVALFNYTNLATAQALGRAPEVGIRKTMGASRGALFGQFTVEAIALTTAASALAAAALWLALPALNDAVQRNAQFNPFEPKTALFLMVVALVTGVAAAAYPARILAWMQAARVLSGSGSSGRSATRLRSIMLGMQFTLAVVLTALVFVIDAQNARINEAAKVFDREHIVSLLNIRQDMRPSYDRLVEELGTIPGVRAVAGTNFVPFDGGKSVRKISASADAEPAVAADLYHTDEQYLSVFDIPLVAGRGLDRARGDVLVEWEEGAEPEQAAILINERAARALGYERSADGVGQVLYRAQEDGPQTYRVVGVVEDRPLGGVFGGLKPAMFILRPGTFGNVSIRIDPARLETVVPEIELAWNRVYPDYPITRSFLEEQFNNHFGLFETINGALAALAMLAVGLSCLGLFGLGAFMAERRTREVGLRKILGASLPRLIRSLLWQISRPVIVAIAIGTPLALLAAQQYLGFFSDRADVGPSVFLASAALVLAIAWLSVSLHVIRAVRANPMQTLRHR